MAPGTSSGEQTEGKARHTRTRPHQLVSSIEPFSCKHSLFVRTEWGSKHKRYVIVNTCYDDDDTDDRSNINLINFKKKKKGREVGEVHRFRKFSTRSTHFHNSSTDVAAADNLLLLFLFDQNFSRLFFCFVFFSVFTFIYVERASVGKLLLTDINDMN